MRTVKQQAALDLVKFAGVILAAQAVVFLGIKFLTPEVAITIAVVAMMAYTIRTLFQIRCSQIEFERKYAEKSAK